MIIFCVVGGWVMVLTSGRIKRHRYSFATFAAIRRALSRTSNVRFTPKILRCDKKRCYSITSSAIARRF
jgi:hypothetical protein